MAQASKKYTINKQKKLTPKTAKKSFKSTTKKISGDKPLKADISKVDLLTVGFKEDTLQAGSSRLVLKSGSRDDLYSKQCVHIIGVKGRDLKRLKCKRIKNETGHKLTVTGSWGGGDVYFNSNPFINVADLKLIPSNDDDGIGSGEMTIDTATANDGAPDNENTLLIEKDNRLYPKLKPYKSYKKLIKDFPDIKDSLKAIMDDGISMNQTAKKEISLESNEGAWITEPVIKSGRKFYNIIKDSDIVSKNTAVFVAPRSVTNRLSAGELTTTYSIGYGASETLTSNMLLAPDDRPPMPWDDTDVTYLHDVVVAGGDDGHACGYDDLFGMGTSGAGGIPSIKTLLDSAGGVPRLIPNLPPQFNQVYDTWNVGQPAKITKEWSGESSFICDARLPPNSWFNASPPETIWEFVRRASPDVSVHHRSCYGDWEEGPPGHWDWVDTIRDNTLSQGPGVKGYFTHPYFRPDLIIEYVFNNNQDHGCKKCDLILLMPREDINCLPGGRIIEIRAKYRSASAGYITSSISLIRKGAAIIPSIQALNNNTYSQAASMAYHPGNTINWNGNYLDQSTDLMGPMIAAPQLIRGPWRSIGRNSTPANLHSMNMDGYLVNNQFLPLPQTDDQTSWSNDFEADLEAASGRGNRHLYSGQPFAFKLSLQYSDNGSSWFVSD